MNKWQDLTDLEVNAGPYIPAWSELSSIPPDSLAMLAEHCRCVRSLSMNLAHELVASSLSTLPMSKVSVKASMRSWSSVRLPASSFFAGLLTLAQVSGDGQRFGQHMQGARKVRGACEHDLVLPTFAHRARRSRPRP